MKRNHKVGASMVAGGIAPRYQPCPPGPSAVHLQRSSGSAVAGRQRWRLGLLVVGTVDPAV